jgi:hypothetical protein
MARETKDIIFASFALTFLRQFSKKALLRGHKDIISSNDDNMQADSLNYLKLRSSTAHFRPLVTFINLLEAESVLYSVCSPIFTLEYAYTEFREVR